jgi:hypothetical protein
VAPFGLDTESTWQLVTLVERQTHFKPDDCWGDGYCADQGTRYLENPNEVITLEQDKLGQVKLERRNHLRGKNDADVPVDMIQASIHLEKHNPPSRSGWPGKHPQSFPVT